jgi:cellulose biosynthesis protein BcsQ
MFSDLGLEVVTADLDPQANLTTMFLTEERLEEFWRDSESDKTVLGPILPLLEGEGGVGEPHVEWVERIGLLLGDLGLSSFEDELSQQWPRCLSRERRAFRVIGAFSEVLRKAATKVDADLLLIDVGPNLGAINRAALIAADHVCIPVAPDLFSLKGLQNLGPRLRRWRTEWQDRLQRSPAGMELPQGRMEPIGYVVMQHAVRLDRPVKAYAKWMARIPGLYRETVLDERAAKTIQAEDDPHCLSMLKHYRSLMPMAQEARKPMFFLKPADGAIGAHVAAVQDCYRDFRGLAQRIAGRCGIAL